MTDPTRCGHHSPHDRKAQPDLPPILAGLCRAGGPAADTLVRSLEPLEFPRNHVIFAEGDPGDRLYVIRSGKIKIRRTSSDGRQTLLAIIGASEVFGDLSVFDPGPRTSTAMTVTDVGVVSMPGAAVRQCIARRPDVAEQLLLALARQQRQVEAMLADRLYRDVPGRLAKALLQLAQRFGSRGTGGLRVRHDLTQQEIAEYVGARRETVNKALAGFAKRGWVRLEGKTIVILNPAKLAGRIR